MCISIIRWILIVCLLYSLCINFIGCNLVFSCSCLLIPFLIGWHQIFAGINYQIMQLKQFVYAETVCPININAYLSDIA